MIIIQALEDAGEVHTGNELQYIKNSSSQTFLSHVILMCLILSNDKKTEYEISVIISFRFHSYETIFKQKIKWTDWQESILYSLYGSQKKVDCT